MNTIRRWIRLEAGKLLKRILLDNNKKMRKKFVRVKITKIKVRKINKKKLHQRIFK